MPLLIDDQAAPVVVSPSFLSGAQDNVEIVNDIRRRKVCASPILIGNRLGEIEDARDVPRSVADGTAVEAVASTQHTKTGGKRRFFTSANALAATGGELQSFQTNGRSEAHVSSILSGSDDPLQAEVEPFLLPSVTALGCAGVELQSFKTKRSSGSDAPLQVEVAQLSSTSATASDATGGELQSFQTKGWSEAIVSSIHCTIEASTQSVPHLKDGFAQTRFEFADTELQQSCAFEWECGHSHVVLVVLNYGQSPQVLVSDQGLLSAPLADDPQPVLVGQQWLRRLRLDSSVMLAGTLPSGDSKLFVITTFVGDCSLQEWPPTFQFWRVGDLHDHCGAWNFGVLPVTCLVFSLTQTRRVIDLVLARALAILGPVSAKIFGDDAMIGVRKLILLRPVPARPTPDLVALGAALRDRVKVEDELRRDLRLAACGEDANYFHDLAERVGQ